MPQTESGGKEVTSGGLGCWQGRLRLAFLVVLTLVFMMGTFPSLVPCPEGEGLGPSWVIGINEATSRGMTWGREVVFTYGPLGFLFSPMDVGTNLHTAVVFRLLSFSLLWLALALNVHQSRNLLFGLMLFVIVALSGVYEHTCETIEVATLAYLIHAWFRQSVLWALPAVILSGLALLVKFNVGMGCTATLAVWAACALVKRPGWHTIVRLGLLTSVGAGTFLTLFLVYGGSPAAIPTFFHYSYLLAYGYSAQMSLGGPLWWLFLALGQLVLIGVTVAAGAYRDRRYLVLGVLLFPSLWMAFKSGYVRQDLHVLHFQMLVPIFAWFVTLFARQVWERFSVLTMVLAVLMMSACWRLSVLPEIKQLLPSGRTHLSQVCNWSINRDR